jgi:hypothetical protein
MIDQVTRQENDPKTRASKSGDCACQTRTGIFSTEMTHWSERPTSALKLEESGVPAVLVSFGSMSRTPVWS